MLDLGFIRDNPDVVKKAVRDKAEKADLEAVLELDKKRRALIQRVEELRAERNKTSKEISELKKQSSDTKAQEKAEALILSMRKVADDIKAVESGLSEAEAKLHQGLLWIPNIPAPDVPVGRDDSENQVVRTWGTRKEFSFEPKPHWEIAAAKEIFDFARASKLAGTGFVLFRGLGARLERALINFMLDVHTKEHGYEEVSPPYLVNRECAIGTGQLPKTEEDMYRCEVDDFFLVPTAEVPVTNMHRDEVLQEAELPLRYTAYTACFRREAGSYGKDTRGMTRVHQFDKVELVKLTQPEDSYDELEKLLADAEAILQRLGLEYRVAKLCTGELSFAASKCYDIEVWAPGVEKYLEVSSCSNFEDFQARRINIRYRDANGKLRYVHTLNGSGVALARLVIAIVETYQNEDGSIAIPPALQEYMGGISKIGAAE
jgi:seryl-tRNA synthetase